jgi:guanyl-specific ribonuclease Sa
MNGGNDMKNRETKSKVMSLGNRLASRIGRHEAFVRAWQIVKAGGLELAVRGVSFGNRQEALKRLAAYAPDQVRAFVVPEPENAADRKAARVMVGVQNGRGLYCLGYLPSDYAPAAASLKARGLRLLGGDIRGARLALAV